MSRQAYSLFLCGLLASTFVHDFNVRANLVSNVLDSVSGNNTLPPGCDLQGVCDNSTTTAINSTTPPSVDSPEERLKMVANADANLLAIINITEKGSLIIDVAKNITGLIDAKNLKGIIIDLKTQSGVYLTQKDNFINTDDLEEFLKSLTGGLTPLLQLSGATKFQVSSASQEILEAVNKVLESLLPKIKKELQAKPKVGIQLVVAISSKLGILFQGPLTGLLEILGSTGFNPPEDLAGIANTLEGLAAFYGALPGGLTALGKLGIKLDSAAIANKENAFERLAYFFDAIGTKIDLGSALSSLLNDEKSALNFLTLLGGNSNEEVNGLIKSIAKLAQFTNKVLPLEVLLNELIQYLGANKGKDGDKITDQAKQGIDILLKAIDTAGATEKLSGFVETLKKLKEDKYESGGINVSQIILVLQKGLSKPGGLLGVLVLVLKLLVVVVDIVVSVPVLLLVLLLNLSSVLGLDLLQALGLLLNVVLGPIVGLTGGLLSTLLGSVTGLLGSLLGDIVGVLGSLPVVGDLVKSLEDALKEAGVDKDLKSLLRSNPATSNLLKAALQLIGSLNLNAPSGSVQKIQQMVQNIATVNMYISTSLNVNITA